MEIEVAMRTRMGQASRTNRRGGKSAAKSQRRGFTLVELLTVIGILVILMAILVPTLGRVREKAYATRTLATMSNLASDIEAYYQRFHAYPGPMSTAVTTASGNAKISGTQNMLLGLTYAMAPASGSTTPASPIPAPVKVGNSYSANGPIDYASMTPTGAFEQVPPYFSPSKQVGPIAGAPQNALPNDFPVVFDAFPDALPILYFRHTPGVSALPVRNPSSGIASYYSDENAEYLNAPLVAPDGAALPQGSSVVTGTSDWGQNYFTLDLGFAVTQSIPTPTYKAGSPPSLPASATAHGGFVLISAGSSRYYGSYIASGSGIWKDDNLILVGGE